ncbi:MAG: hypothetical protein EOL88_07080 [Bacteroidia bacterium]|nr:hypothetical protein [Bacteroidia bacterium]
MRRIKNFVFVSIVIVLFSACEKQDSNSQLDLRTTESKMLIFEDQDQFVETLIKLVNMQPEERKQWEESQSFLSIGRKADEFYLSSNFEKFSSQEEILEYANKTDLLQIVEDKGGISIEPIYHQHDYRFVANENGFYQIADNIFLVLEEVIISTDISNKNELSKINSFNYSEFVDSEIIKAQKIFDDNPTYSLKDATYNCGTYHDQRVTSNNDRTYLRISVHSENLVLGTHQWVSYTVRPYKKTFGVWYWCSRSISSNISIAADYLCYYSQNSTPYWERVTQETSCSNYSSSSFSGTLCSHMVSHNFYVTPQGHFGGYDCWADTPSTSPNVVLQANTFLCP